MAKFTFKLESLLNIKTKLEDKAKTEYGKANLKLQQEKELLQNLQNKKDNAIFSFKKSVSNNVNTNETIIFNRFIYNMDCQIKNQQENISLAKNLVEEKRKELIEAMKQRKIFDTLKENQKQSFNKEILLNEQKFIDEIVSYKYNKG